jgi:hypothetical protein
MTWRPAPDGMVPEKCDRNRNVVESVESRNWF